MDFKGGEEGMDGVVERRFGQLNFACFTLIPLSLIDDGLGVHSSLIQ